MTQHEYNQRLFQLTHAFKIARRDSDQQAIVSALAAVSAHTTVRPQRQQSA